MCGIAGLFDPQASEADLEAAGRQFTSRLRHRGPDAQRALAMGRHSLVMAHTRLSILDLSDAGAQPMESADGRFVITFNGEIYNHLDLRTQLGTRGGPFRGESDTETLLAAISAWGLTETLRRCRGMFALAVFDRETDTLSMARDRFGQKPIFYGRIGSKFVYTSNLEALGRWRNELTIDRQSLYGFLQTGSVAAGRSIYEEFKKLDPGEIIQFQLGPTGAKELKAEKYWDFVEMILQAQAEPFTGSLVEAIDRLDHLLFEAVKLRMLSDVPIGSLLSGGVDSSLITAMMQRASSSPIQTFTAGFSDHALDESHSAAEVSQHLGTNQDVLEVQPSDLIDLLPSLPPMNGEPFADPSQIPTHLICRHARQSVTVCLAGDGGDELFGGYPWQPRATNLIKRLSPIPAPARAAAAVVLRAAGSAVGDRRGRWAANMARAIDVDNPLDARLALTGAWKQGAVPLQSINGQQIEALRTPTDWPSLAEPEHQMLWYDSVTFLPDLVLTKVDRASMWASLEARAPLLDHEVAAFAWSLPTEWRTGPRRSDGRQTNKWILRRLLDRYIPPAITERPKQGFDVPIADWLRGELRDWAGDLLSPARLGAAGHLDPGPIQAAWNSHQAGRDDHSARLWTVLMFESWMTHLETDTGGGTEACLH